MRDLNQRQNVRGNYLHVLKCFNSVDITLTDPDITIKLTALETLYFC